VSVMAGPSPELRSACRTSYTEDQTVPAIHRMAPACEHCGCTVIGHGVQAGGRFFCCAHCARAAGARGALRRSAGRGPGQRRVSIPASAVSAEGRVDSTDPAETTAELPRTFAAAPGGGRPGDVGVGRVLTEIQSRSNPAPSPRRSSRTCWHGRTQRPGIVSRSGSGASSPRVREASAPSSTG
jgi:hypothetical protein